MNEDVIQKLRERLQIAEEMTTKRQVDHGNRFLNYVVNIRKTAEFFDVIRKHTSEDIGKPELEVYYYIVKGTITNKFTSNNDIIAYVTKCPKQYMGRDRKLFTGKNGYLNKLFKAKLLQHDKKAHGNKKKTHKYSPQIIPAYWSITYPEIKTVWGEGFDHHFNDITHQWTPEDTIRALEWFLFAEKGSIKFETESFKELRTLRDRFNDELLSIGLVDLETLNLIFYPQRDMLKMFDKAIEAKNKTEGKENEKQRSSK